MKLSLPPANLRCGKVMFPQASDRQSFCPRGEGGGGSHVTIIHDALEHGTYPAPCIHQTWYLHPPVYDIWLVITGDLFKLFSPEDPSPPPPPPHIQLASRRYASYWKLSCFPDVSARFTFFFQICRTVIWCLSVLRQNYHSGTGWSNT